MFNYENYRKLFHQIAESARLGEADVEDDLEALRKAALNFFNYVTKVNTAEIEVQFSKVFLTGEDRGTKVEEVGRDRRTAHEAAIASAAQVNRMAAFYGVGPIYEGDLKQRLQVAQMCIEATDVIFANRII